MNAATLVNEVDPAEAALPSAEAVRKSPPLQVLPALRRFKQAVRSAWRRGGDEARQARREAVLALLTAVADDGPNTVAGFERVLNGCLDLGYRAQPLAAFVFDALQRRLAGRVRRRLARSGHDPDCAEVADLVSATAVAVQKLIRGARRERHTLRYALLISIADHRTIDYLRRRRPEYRESMDDQLHGDSLGASGEHTLSPERALWQAERNALALALQGAVLGAVNALAPAERRALVLVEIEGLGYPAVAERTGMKRTDVGNVVRRARLQRDRAFVARLRDVEGLDQHLGFGGLQAHRELRLNMLTWAAEIGQGLCPCCRADGFLHAASAPCPAA